MLSCFRCVRFYATLWTADCQAPLSMGFPRQEYWSGSPCPSLGNLPDLRIEPTSVTSPLLAGRFFTTSITWEAPYMYNILFIHSSVDWHLGCFHVLAIVNNATVNIGARVYSSRCAVWLKYSPEAPHPCLKWVWEPCRHSFLLPLGWDLRHEPQTVLGPANRKFCLLAANCEFSFLLKSVSFAWSEGSMGGVSRAHTRTSRWNFVELTLNTFVLWSDVSSLLLINVCLWFRVWSEMCFHYNPVARLQVSN